MISFKSVLELATIILLTSSFGAGLTLPYNCKDDQDCTKENTYCYTSGECVPCTDCQVYYREASVGCAKDKNQCGKCRPGMDTDTNLDGTITCYPSGTVSPHTQKPEQATFGKMNTILAIITVTVAVGCCVIFWLFKSRCSCVLVRSILTICPINLMNTGNYRPPPPYTEKSPSAPPFEEPTGIPASPIFQTVSPNYENDTNQTANPFNNPQYVGGGTLASNPYQDQPEDEQEEPAENETLISSTTDEETQPSSWSPSVNRETDSTGPTTFSNVLNIQQLTISQPDFNVSTVQLTQETSGRSNSQPNIQFNNTQFNSTNSENMVNNNNFQQINIISHVDTVIVNSSISQ